MIITIDMAINCVMAKEVVLTKTMLSSPNHSFLSIYLLEISLDECNFYKPYYDILPKDLKSMPIFWSEEEIGKLYPSNIINEIEMKKKSIEYDYRLICEKNVKFKQFTIEQFKWARMIVCR